MRLFRNSLYQGPKEIVQILFVPRLLTIELYNSQQIESESQVKHSVLLSQITLQLEQSSQHLKRKLVIDEIHLSLLTQQVTAQQLSHLLQTLRHLTLQLRL